MSSQHNPGYNDPRSNPQPGYGSSPGQGQGPQYGQGQQPGYGQPSNYGSYSGGGYGPGYSQTPRKRGGRGGKITFFVGLVMLLLGVAGLIAGSVMMFNQVSSQFDPNTGLPNAFSGSTQIQASEGEAYLLMAVNPQGTATCQVTGPDGTAVDVNTSASSSQSEGQVTVESVGFFTASSEGSHAVSCSGAQEFSYIGVDAGSLVAGSMLLLGGVLLGVLGLIITIVGLILWLVGRNKTV